MTPTPDVVRAAQTARAKWGIPASVSIAQFALESGWGKHIPPGSNNPFGIKARPGQAGVSVPTHEYVAGRYITINAAFRAFPSLDAAFDAHAQLLAQAKPYAHARSLLPDVHAFCNALTGVYATDPHYGAELIHIIDGDDLQRLDAPPPQQEAA